MQRGRYNRQTNRGQGAAQSNEHQETSEGAEVDHVENQLKSMMVRVDKKPHVISRSVNNVQNSEDHMPKQWGSLTSINRSRDDRATPFYRYSPSHFSCTPLSNSTNRKGASLSVHSGSQDGLSPQAVQGGECALSRKYREHLNLDDQHKVHSFDICLKSTGNVAKMKSPIFSQNRARRNERKRQESVGNIIILRPGLVLLKGHLSLTDQVKLVKSCRDHGLGSGGFYQPGYRHGRNLHLKRMCFGKHWDCETSLYSDVRPDDGSIPPPIPNELHRIVTGVIQECHDHLKLQPGVRNPEDILPSMSPSICIVNFYSKTGKLGLHQDKSESPESLRRGLPVVSLSVGDTAEFVYGDDRDIFMAEKVLLESGDVLIFGGKSRHMFHGVSSIFADTAPKALIDETSLKPGRLNLTFRQY